MYMKKRTLARGWNAWRAHIWSKEERLRLMKQALMGWIKGQLKKGWNSWRASYLGRNRGNRVLLRARQRWYFLMLNTRAALANRAWMSMHDAALRVQKES